MVGGVSQRLGQTPVPSRKIGQSLIHQPLQLLPLWARGRRLVLAPVHGHHRNPVPPAAAPHPLGEGVVGGAVVGGDRLGRRSVKAAVAVVLPALGLGDPPHRSAGVGQGTARHPQGLQSLTHGPGQPYPPAAGLHVALARIGRGPSLGRGRHAQGLQHPLEGIPEGRAVGQKGAPHPGMAQQRGEEQAVVVDVLALSQLHLHVGVEVLAVIEAPAGVHIAGVDVVGLIAQETEHMETESRLLQQLHERREAAASDQRLGELLGAEQHPRRLGRQTAQIAPPQGPTLLGQGRGQGLVLP